jgi:hypothetical protein
MSIQNHNVKISRMGDWYTIQVDGAVYASVPNRKAVRKALCKALGGRK